MKTSPSTCPGPRLLHSYLKPTKRLLSPAPLSSRPHQRPPGLPLSRGKSLPGALYWTPGHQRLAEWGPRLPTAAQQSTLDHRPAGPLVVGALAFSLMPQNNPKVITHLSSSFLTGFRNQISVNRAITCGTGRQPPKHQRLGPPTRAVRILKSPRLLTSSRPVLARAHLFRWGCSSREICVRRVRPSPRARRRLPGPVSVPHQVRSDPQCSSEGLGALSR